MQQPDDAARRRLAEIVQRRYYDAQFLTDLLSAYGYSMNDLAQLKTQNQAASPDEIIYPNLVYFKFQKSPTTHASLNSILAGLKYHFLTEAYQPKYLIVTDFSRLVAWRFRTGQKLTTTLADLERHADFFADFFADRRREFSAEISPANFQTSPKVESALDDRRAADYAKSLYDILLQNSQRQKSQKQLHYANQFFTFLLFCFFAQDLGVFAPGSFSELIKNETDTDGKNLKLFFQNLINYLLNFPSDSDEKNIHKNSAEDFSTKKSDFSSPEIFQKLKINSKSFAIFKTFLRKILNKNSVPDFNAETRQLLLRSGKFDWSLINPDVFGTIYQSITEKKLRNARGMDYTSTENVLKVIEPLFLNKLTAEFEKNFSKPEKLKNLLFRISRIRIFDPACGSGNFLIISYKKLRELELNIFLRLRELGEFNEKKFYKNSTVRLEAFFGIELEDLPHILAQLSLILAKYQMDLIFLKNKIPVSPENNFAKIICANSARVDWQDFCPTAPFNSDSETQVYLVGNPPYKGATKQSAAQKKDFADYFGQEEYSKNLNYIALWLIKGARYIENKKAELAFIVADSACQGEQVGLIFPKILATGAEIGFAYRPFHWANNAKHQSGVDVAILNLRRPSDTPKFLFSAQGKKAVPEINPYLVASAQQTIVTRHSVPPPNFPPLLVGSMPLDGGNLILQNDERNEFLAQGIPEKFLRPLLGAEEILNLPVNITSNLARENPSEIPRWCLWIRDQEYLRAQQFPSLAQRFQKVADYRQKSSRPTTKKAARFPYRFGENRHQNSTHALVIPSLCSKQRTYFPMAFLNSQDLFFSNTALVIYDAPLWLFALLQSRHHMVWLRTVCSTLGDSYRYTATLAYNTFPAPALPDSAKRLLEKSARDLLAARQQFPAQSLAELYRDMPENLKSAHTTNDQLVDELYGQTQPDDALRLARLFDLYNNNL